MNRRDSLKTGASLVAGLTLVSATACASTEITQTSCIDVIKTRRSVRQFKPDAVPYEHLKEMVNAARMSPTSGNQQPWKFIIVQEKEKIKAIKDECIEFEKNRMQESRNLQEEEIVQELKAFDEHYSKGYFSAPAFIVVLTDGESKYPSYNHHDGPLAAGYLLLAARSMGYGTVYVTDAIPVEATKKALNIPDRYTRVCITPVGVPIEWPEKEKKSLDEFIINESF